MFSDRSVSAPPGCPEHIVLPRPELRVPVAGRKRSSSAPPTIFEVYEEVEEVGFHRKRSSSARPARDNELNAFEIKKVEECVKKLETILATFDKSAELAADPQTATLDFLSAVADVVAETTTTSESEINVTTPAVTTTSESSTNITTPTVTTLSESSTNITTPTVITPTVTTTSSSSTNITTPVVTPAAPSDSIPATTPAAVNRYKPGSFGRWPTPQVSSENHEQGQEPTCGREQGQEPNRGRRRRRRGRGRGGRGASKKDPNAPEASTANASRAAATPGPSTASRPTAISKPAAVNRVVPNRSFAAVAAGNPTTTTTTTAAATTGLVQHQPLQPGETWADEVNEES